MYFMIFCMVCSQPFYPKIFSILSWNCFIHLDAGKMIEKAFSSLTALMETISFKFQHCNNSMTQQQGHGQLWMGPNIEIRFGFHYFVRIVMQLQLLVSIKSISCWVSEMPVHSHCWALRVCADGEYWENIVMAVLWWTQWGGCHH